MNVKPDLFIRTTENILQNKQEFLNIQIEDCDKRKKQLTEANQTLKQKLKKLKKQSAIKMHDNKENNNFNQNETFHSEQYEQEFQQIEQKMMKDLKEWEKKLQLISLRNTETIQKLQCRIQQYRQLCQSKVMKDSSTDVLTQRIANTQKRKKPLKTTSVALANSIFLKTDEEPSLKQNSNNSSFYFPEANKSMGYYSRNSINSTKRMNNKSYGKIITKLVCEGCKLALRPFQYYQHKNCCISYQKRKLIQQKQDIQRKINQTLRMDGSYLVDI